MTSLGPVGERHVEERLALIGRLTGGVAHDLKGLMSVIVLQCDLLAVADHTQADHDVGLKSILDACEAVSAMATRLNEVWSGGAGMLTCDPVATVLGHRALLRSLVAPGMHVVVDVIDGCAGRVGLSASGIFQVISNLVVNANDALMTDGRGRGRVMITLGPGTPADAGPDSGTPTVVITVADDGPGIAESVRDELFSTTVSTRGPGRGLGLATVVAITESAGGRVRLVDTPSGTVVEVALPVVTG